MKKMLLSAFVALTFGVSTFANQIAKDENFEFEEELVVDCYQFAEANVAIFNAQSIVRNKKPLSEFEIYIIHSYFYDECYDAGVCTTCLAPVTVSP